MRPHRLHLRLPIAALTALPALAAAQSGASAPTATGRPLGAVAARSADSLGPLLAVRPLPNGRVLVHDALSRRVLLYDSTLARGTVVADTTAATANAYGSRIAGFVPFRGDSTLLVDAAALSMTVIDPAGKLTRVMSVPRPQDAFALVGLGSGGTPGVDPQGRLVYRGMAMPTMRPPQAGGPGGFQMPAIPDTNPILRVDLASRAVDTVGWVKQQVPKSQVTRDDATGEMRVTIEANPLPVVDDWALAPDGGVALLRGGDYRVDWVEPQGARRSTPKIAFDWQRLSDDDKVAFLDSVKALRERQLAEGGPAAAMAGMGTGGGGGAVIMQRGGGPGGSGGPPPGASAGGGEVRITIGGGPGGPGGGPGAAPGGARPGGPGMMVPQVNFVSPSELPDYRPAFLPGALRVDADGRLWVRTTRTRGVPAGMAVYDVVDRAGAVVDRVQVPTTRSIAGFGSDGSVYLVGRDGARTVLERAAVR